MVPYLNIYSIKEAVVCLPLATLVITFRILQVLQFVV